MSRHEGVSCDSCMKSNFRGRRYKCLICYDYDLCASCYENGATTPRHTAEHPMQCILTRSDFDIYYGGESITLEQTQAFTCPYCGKMGFTEITLQEHVTSDHADSSQEVVCPVCAAVPGGEPNLVTDDFAAHLTLEHRTVRDLDEAAAGRHVRRMFHPGRGLGPRTRRTNMHFSSGSGLSSQPSSSPSSRETMDPIAELLSQLSGVRRSAGHSTASQLQQLQIMQLQLERQQVQHAQQGSTRQQVERLPVPRRQMVPSNNNNPNQSSSGGVLGNAASNTQRDSQFLLSRINGSSVTDPEQQAIEEEQADRSFFLQDLILSTLNDSDKESDTSESIHESSGAWGYSDDPSEVTLDKFSSLQLRDKSPDS
ncbi:E3 ubiquitin-protein ligase KCMF1-like [Antedon mediterranea]|uniref:E3 ubiquitin-protein ligase KCMF1-like n=1 Tax=Antedon mediterranea TaxID=105859 RepID=UPI003AF43BB7